MQGFSASVRAELARVRAKDECCARAELAGMIRAAGSLYLTGQRSVGLSVQTEYADVARKAVTLLRTVAGLGAEVVVEEHTQLRQGRAYRIRLAPEPGVRRLLLELGILSADGQLLPDLPGSLLRKDCCRASFLRGAYMMHGSVCDPSRSGYHLEIVASGEDFGLGLCYLLNLIHLKARLERRKDQHVVYMKDADDIALFLSLTGAQAARLRLEEVRVVKEVRGGVNRLVNAETANLDKSAAAAVEQLRLIELLKTRGLLNVLPANLRQVAEARLANPEATLAELGQFLQRPASKSAVNHRLRKLRRLAEALLGEEGRRG
ncbi:MAG: DNA-binding protein WhiA [Patescibacteria group bacterium]